MPSPVSRRYGLHHLNFIATWSRGPSTSDDLSLASSSSSANSRGVDDLPSASAAAEENKNNNVDCRYQQYHMRGCADDDAGTSISESSFNGYAALAKLVEEEW